MKCISCGQYSLNIICKTCQSEYFTPTLNKREIVKDFYVYSFYKYEDIKEFLDSKYYFYGDRVFKILADLSFKHFSKNFNYENLIYVLNINDNNKNYDFSQTAILARALKSNTIKVLYNKLNAKNSVKYAGKSLAFRKQNPRKFIYAYKENVDVILVDDIVTTGTTLLEAKKVLESNNCNVLFALTLSDAQN